MTHPRNVGWGEIGLDYHYDNSPRDVQRDVFSRQLRHAVRLGKPITVHTREADEDTERILKAEVPKDHKVGRVRRYIGWGTTHRLICGEPQIHVHCFTDSPDFGQRLLDHFPNLFIGITGMILFVFYLARMSTTDIFVPRCDHIFVQRKHAQPRSPDVHSVAFTACHP
jgi:TatD DNase family protein